MATAIYTARVENWQFGGFMEFEFEIDVDAPLEGEEFDPSAYDDKIYAEIMDNLSVEWDFDRLED